VYVIGIVSLTKLRKCFPANNLEQSNTKVEKCEIVNTTIEDKMRL